MLLVKGNCRLDSTLVPNFFQALFPLLESKGLVDDPINFDLARL